MTRELFIHVGAGKTGTSAIQEFLLLNEKQLATQNLVIPKIGLVSSKKFHVHHRLAGGTSATPVDPFHLWKEIAKMESNRILVSSEIFHSRISQKKGIQFFKRILSFFPDRNVKIIFYIRRQDQWIQSAYEQWIKSGRLSNGSTIREFVGSFKSNLADQLDLFAKVFGIDNVIAKPYEKQQFIEGNIFSDFCAIFGIKVDAKFKVPIKNANPRLSTDALATKRILNQFLKNGSDKRIAKIMARDLLSYSRLSGSDSDSIYHDHNLLSLHERREIIENLAPTYARIAREFLGRKDGVLFFNQLQQEPKGKKPNHQTDDINQVIVYTIFELYRKIDWVLQENEKLQYRLEQLERDGSEKLESGIDPK